MAVSTIVRESQVFGNMYVLSLYNIGNSSTRVRLNTTTTEQLFFIIAVPANSNTDYYIATLAKGAQSSTAVYQKIISGTSLGYGREDNIVWFNAPSWTHIMIFSNQGFAGWTAIPT